MRKALSALVVLMFVFGACGREGPIVDRQTAEETPAGDFPVTVNTPDGPLTISDEPVRIVSLSPTATEMLFAIGADEQVVAVDDQSNYPPEAPKTKLSGFQPNVEAVAKYRPDLVVFSGETNELGDQFEAINIQTIRQPAAKKLGDTYRQITDLGRSTGHTSEAEQLVDQMNGDIEVIAQQASSFDEPPTYYHELTQDYYTVTSSTFIGQVYALLGLENVADPADKAGNGYPQVSAEFVIKADPDVIFLADTKCCQQSKETVAARPGWNNITAVKNGNVVALDDDIASRWGPRIVDFLRTVGKALSEAENLTS